MDMSRQRKCEHVKIVYNLRVGLLGLESPGAVVNSFLRLWLLGFS